MTAQFDALVRKLPAYFDGGLRDSERAQVEALVASSPEFAQLFRRRQQELEDLRRRVPDAKLDAEAQEALEGEVREVIEHLFKDEDAGLAKRLGTWLRERL